MAAQSTPETPDSLDVAFIAQQIRRTNRNLLLTNIGLLLLLLCLGLGKAFVEAGYWWLLILSVASLALWNVVKGLRRIGNPSLHPITASLAEYGAPEKIAELINQDIALGARNTKSLILTKGWIIHTSLYVIQIMRVKDLVWVHKKVTQHSTYGIPTRKEFGVILYMRNGKSFETMCKEEEADTLLKDLLAAAPWVVPGFSQQLQSLWSSNREAFIAQVDKKRAALLGESEATRSGADDVEVHPTDGNAPSKQTPRNAPETFVWFRRITLLVLFLVGVPMCTFFVGIWAEVHLEKQWRTELINYAKEQGIEPTETGLSSLSLPNLCSGNTDLDPKEGFSELCDTYNKLDLLILLSLLAGLVGISLPLAITVAGWFARLHRGILLFIFSIGLYASLFAGVCLLVTHCVLLALAIYYGEGVLAGQVHTGLLVSIILAGAIGVFNLILPAFSSIRKIKTTAFGKTLAKDLQPKLWDEIKGAAAKLNALCPDHIVACLGEAFYVTEADVICLDGTLQGRTLVLSLPFMRQLKREELIAVVGHELGHFRGADTKYSRRFYPIYKGTQEALSGLSDTSGSEMSLVYLPVFGLLNHFLDAFSRVESRFSRTRELIADECGAALTSKQAMASALTKIYAYSGLWAVVSECLCDAISRRKQIINVSSLMSDVLTSADRVTLIKQLSASVPAHPTDTHPPFKARMDKLGFGVEDFESDIQHVPLQSSLELIVDAEELEKELSDLEHARLIRSGIVELPEEGETPKSPEFR